MYGIAMMHGDGDGMMGGSMSGWMGGWMLLWAVLALALIVLAVVATVWLVRHLSGSRSGGGSAEVLDRLYASGEIDRREFLQRREDLARRS